MDRKMTTNTPLKTNTRWQRDESSEDKKSSTFSDNRFRHNNGYHGGNRGGGFQGRSGGYRGRSGGYRGRSGRGRSGRGRGGFRDGYRGRNSFRDCPPKPKEFVLPDGNRLETDFPILGKPKVKNASDLNWRIAAEKGAVAPPPPIFVKKKSSVKLNSADQDIDLDDYDEEEYDSAFCDEDDSFPTKGGYMD